MRFLLILVSLLFCNCLLVEGAQTPVKIRRVCNSASNNIELFWFATKDICPLYHKYYIWAKVGVSGTAQIIDSTSNVSTETYTHINANSGGAKNWYYYIEYRDSCGPVFSVFSDTVNVDVEQKIPTYIDSVSVNPTSGSVFIGWRQNTAPDFAIYDLFRDDGVFSNQYTKLVSLRDTSYFDISSGTKADLGPVKYDIDPKDSCGNTAPFDDNPHRTIYLKTLVDTCTKTVRLTWTPYTFTWKKPSSGIVRQYGWLCGVRYYYIYKSTNNAPFVIVDSIASPPGGIIEENSFYFIAYSDSIILGATIRYFIRAQKDTTILLTTSSNVVAFQTRYRKDPSAPIITSVSVEPLNNSGTTITVNSGYGSEWKSLSTNRILPGGSLYNIGSFNHTNFYDSLFSFTDNVDPSVSKYDYSVTTSNLCGASINTVYASNSIFVRNSSSGSVTKIIWNKYYFWINGIDYYRIYRGTNVNSETLDYSLLDSTSAIDTAYSDLHFPETIGNKGVCYYVEAILLNSVSNRCFSNHMCILGQTQVYIPSAFCPNGLNRVFDVSGSYIDFHKSSMEIYNRWGQSVFNKTDINFGWDGKGYNGEDLMAGVYFYRIKIIGSDGSEQTKSGTVTLLR